VGTGVTATVRGCVSADGGNIGRARCGRDRCARAGTVGTVGTETVGGTANVGTIETGTAGNRHPRRRSSPLRKVRVSDTASSIGIHPGPRVGIPLIRKARPLKLNLTSRFPYLY